MKKIILWLTSVVMLFCLSSCSLGDLYYVNLEGGAKGIEVYCEKMDDNYECRACEGTNRIKTNDEIKRLYPIELKDMKELLESKDLIDCSRIILIDINDGNVEFLNMETHFEEYEFLYNYFGI